VNLCRFGQVLTKNFFIQGENDHDSRVLCVFHFQGLRMALPDLSSREWFGFHQHTWRRITLSGFSHFPNSISIIAFSFSSRNLAGWCAAPLHLTPTGSPQQPFPSPAWPKAPKKCGLSFSGLLLHARCQAGRTEVTRREAPRLPGGSLFRPG